MVSHGSQWQAELFLSFFINTIQVAGLLSEVFPGATLFHNNVDANVILFKISNLRIMIVNQHSVLFVR